MRNVRISGFTGLLMVVLCVLNPVSMYADEAESSESELIQEEKVLDESNSLVSEPFKPYWTASTAVCFVPWTNQGNIGGEKPNSYAISVEFNGVRWLQEHVFFKVGLGYRSFATDDSFYQYSSATRSSISYSSHFDLSTLYVPAEIGLGASKCGSKVNLFVSAGPYLGLAISSKNEMTLNGTKSKQKTDVSTLGLGLRASISASFGGFNIGVFGTLGIAGHDKKRNYFGFTAGYMI